MKDTAPPDFKPGMGFVPSPTDARDHRLARYVPRLREAVREAPRSRIPYTRNLPLYNQGESSMCVAYSAALASTLDQRRDLRRSVWYDAPEGYARCKERDGIPDVDGTFPRVMLQIKQERGMRILQSPVQGDVGRLSQIGAYVSLRNIEEIVAAIYLYGSVILGSPWYEEWFDVPVSKTLLRPRLDAGGHAYAAVGWSWPRRALLIQNSWGDYWGYPIGYTDGRAWLPFDYINLDGSGDWEAWRSIDIEEP